MENNIYRAVGKVYVDDKALEEIIYRAIVQVDNILPIKENVVEKLIKRSNGIEIKHSDKQLAININCIAKYGTNLVDIREKLLDLIEEDINDMTGLTLVELNLHVKSILGEKEFKDTMEKDFKDMFQGVKEKLEDFGNKVKEKSSDLIHEAEKKMHEAQSNLDEMKDKSADKVGEMKDKAADKVGEMKDKAADKIDHLKNKAEEKSSDFNDNVKDNMQDIKSDDISTNNSSDMDDSCCCND